MESEHMKAMKSMKDARTWAIEDHLCRTCGGRILRCVTGNGITGGGNPVFKCADCGASGASLSPDCLCWCGFAHKHNYNTSAYMCCSFTILEQYPQLKHRFAACGCDSSKGEVGILLREDYGKLISECLGSSIFPKDGQPVKS